jgi:DNA-binding MarR family transcriptional regulator
MREMDLTPRQAAAILELVERPGLSLNALAEALGADQPTASALVDRLLAAGYVRRDTDPSDRRRASLQPTERAHELAEGLTAARQETEQSIHEALGPEDSAELSRLLIRLIERLEVAKGEGARRT